MELFKIIGVYALSAMAAIIALMMLVKKDLPPGASVGFILVGFIAGLLAASAYFVLSLP